MNSFEKWPKEGYLGQTRLYPFMLHIPVITKALRLQVSVTAIRDLVGRIANLNHDVVPTHGCINWLMCCGGIKKTKLWPSHLRKDILDLHERFDSSGGWNLEKVFNTWCCKQTWRSLMPLKYFELLGYVTPVCLTCWIAGTWMWSAHHSPLILGLMWRSHPENNLLK